MVQILNLVRRIVNSSILVLILVFISQNFFSSNLSRADSQQQPPVIVYRSVNSKDGIRTYVSQNGNIDHPLSDLDDMFFEIESPDDIRYTYRIRIAKNFGSSFTRMLKRTQLVIADPFNACGNEILNAQEIKGNVAFIQRGECSFLSKAINAEKAGATAAIITDNDPNNDYLIDMISDETTRNTNIPVVFLQYNDGAMIKKSIEKRFIKTALINIPLNLTFKNKNVLKKAPWSVG